MANPKRRHSNTRTRLRRAHDHLVLKSRSQCPQCNAFILPHRVCTSCGFYKGKQVKTMKVKSKEKE
ncbi:MAG TPA: 50S ribosomal protein L32 [Candidatus Omnitrophota bacterium]|nr:50S ribosomal protein L32 [Candidatus Omnitrophota bacterium]